MTLIAAAVTFRHVASEQPISDASSISACAYSIGAWNLRTLLIAQSHMIFWNS
jgi:hypothetical protein